MSFRPTAHEGTAHCFAKGLVAFEHKSSSLDPLPNTLIWVGGLGDGLLTVRYPTTLASRLPPDWVLAQALLSSAYGGWGTRSLGQDASELAACVAYFRKLRPGTRIAVMGHSTGCQDIAEYLSGRNTGATDRPRLDGAILQAPASDREALLEVLSRAEYDDACAAAAELLAAGKEGEDGEGEAAVMPLSKTRKVFGPATPVSARRFLSLASPDGRGADDFFSSDLPVDALRQTFGRFPRATPVLLLHGARDEYVPASVDKEALLRKWTDVVREGGGEVDEENSGVVPGASHNLQRDGEEAVGELCRRVVAFLRKVSVVGGEANL